jgi:hypothetical protein
MRLIACILAAFAAASPATAQEWKTYTFSAYSFSVAFPAEPKLETTTYQTSDGRTVEASVYSVTQAASLLQMTVVDLKGAPVEDTSAIEYAVTALTQGNEVKLDTPHRVGTVYGRQLSIRRPDGSHSFAAVFYRKWRLYQIEGIALSGQGEADAIRFQQSLEFQQSPDFAEKAPSVESAKRLVLELPSNWVTNDSPQGGIAKRIPPLLHRCAPDLIRSRSTTSPGLSAACPGIR